MKIYNIPIESLKERYSAQWNRWFPAEFNRLGVEYETIEGDRIDDGISVGSFLDVYDTNYYKLSQLRTIVRKIKEGEITDSDILFFHDIWFPGLESLQYIRQGAGKRFKIYGILHAGTYDPYDYLSKCGMGSWGKKVEEAWFSFVDGIFVATRFHRDLLVAQRDIDSEKIHITGLPIYGNEIAAPALDSVYKEDIVVFPHRLDSEKNPQMFDELADRLKNTGWKFIKTKEVCKTKTEYYRLLSKAKIAVSFADQETWGIAQQESLFCGCIPVVPNRLSYREMYYSCFLYTTFETSVLLIERIMKDTRRFQKIASENALLLSLMGESAIEKMTKEMMR